MQASQGSLVERLGALPVEHGRLLCGLSMKDVYEQVRDTAMAAAKQKQNESSSRSQNLLRAYCRARLAMEELEQTASKYGVMPRALLVPHQLEPSDVADPVDKMDTLETALVPMTMSSSSTSLIRQALPIRTTKDGRFRPLALKSSPLIQEHEVVPPGVARGCAWVKSDLMYRTMSCASWLMHNTPLAVHCIWILLLLVTLYLLTRPQLLVRFAVWSSQHLVRVVTSSGAELLRELDKLLLEQSFQVVRPLTEAGPLALARKLFAAQPAIPVPDLKAIAEAAAVHATAALAAQGSTADAHTTAVSAAALALAEAVQHMPEVPDDPEISAPGCVGLGLLCVLILTLSKAGKLLV